jgi:CheY-like chemotaxis protein
MDIAMPVLNGYEATLAIRNLENQHGMQDKERRSYIIGLTGHCSEIYQEKCYESGMNLFCKSL